MQDFDKNYNFNQQYLQNLIEVQAEESTHLDFKDCGSLEKTDKKKAEIGKDISAFANSDGGIIIYGMKEQNHVASAISYIDGNVITKEWLENVIHSQISPLIDGIQIYPIRFDNRISQTVYIVKIPASARVPHMSGDKGRYYRRYNFQSVPMEEYEVRNLFQKTHNSELEIRELLIETSAGSVMAQTTLNSVTYKLGFQIENISNRIEHDYKLEIHFPKGLISYNEIDIKEQHIRDEHDYSIFAFGNKAPLFQRELTTLKTVNINLSRNTFRLLNLPILIYLYYSNGKKEKEVLLAPLLTFQNKKLFDWGWKCV